MTDPLSQWLIPISNELKTFDESKSKSAIINYIDHFHADFDWSKLRQYNVAILGIGNKESEEGLNLVRKAFYSLYIHNNNLKIIDLGNILLDKNNDTDFNKIEEILSEVLKHNVFIIPFGESPVYLNYCYNAIKAADCTVTATYISNTASVGNTYKPIANDNHIAYLLKEIDENLFGLNILAYQLYHSEPESLSLLEKLYCQTLRLGALRSDFKMIEPLLRDSDLLAINMDSVRQCDSPASLHSSPNGLYAEEICQIARYGGISDRLSIAGIFGFNQDKINCDITFMLVGQLIWHFIDGFSKRIVNDSPLKNVNGIKKYIVDMGSSIQQLVFYYSNISERWWMEVPSEKTSSNLLVACSYDDYRAACRQEVPLRWIWFHQKTAKKHNSD